MADKHKKAVKISQNKRGISVWVGKVTAEDLAIKPPANLKEVKRKPDAE